MEASTGFMIGMVLWAVFTASPWWLIFWLSIIALSYIFDEL